MPCVQCSACSHFQTSREHMPPALCVNGAMLMAFQCIGAHPAQVSADRRPEERRWVLCPPSGCSQRTQGRRSHLVTGTGSWSGTVSFTKLGHPTHSHLSDLASSSCPIDCMCVLFVCMCPSFNCVLCFVMGYVLQFGEIALTKSYLLWQFLSGYVCWLPVRFPFLYMSTIKTGEKCVSGVQFLTFILLLHMICQ